MYKIRYRFEVIELEFTIMIVPILATQVGQTVTLLSSSPVWHTKSYYKTFVKIRGDASICGWRSNLQIGIEAKHPTPWPILVLCYIWRWTWSDAMFVVLWTSFVHFTNSACKRLGEGVHAVRNSLVRITVSGGRRCLHMEEQLFSYPVLTFTTLNSKLGKEWELTTKKEDLSIGLLTIGTWN